MTIDIWFDRPVMMTCRHYVLLLLGYNLYTTPVKLNTFCQEIYLRQPFSTTEQKSSISDNSRFYDYFQ